MPFPHSIYNNGGLANNPLFSLPFYSLNFHPLNVKNLFSEYFSFSEVATLQIEQQLDLGEFCSLGQFARFIPAAKKRLFSALLYLEDPRTGI